MLADIFINMFNGLISVFGSIITELINVLPDSPFQSEIISNVLGNIPYLSTLNWFVPVNIIVSITTYWLMAITIYYLISIIMRWTKVIS